jgi:uncharacterized membrane protein YdcZ (DUF606 family)
MPVAVPVALTAAIIAGILVAAQTAVLGVWGARMPALVAAAWVQVAGAVAGVVLVLVTRSDPSLAAVRGAPWGLAAGVAGILLVTGITMAVGGIGIASTLAIVTGVQLLAAFALETAGIGGRTVALDPGRVLGALLIVVGVHLVASRGVAAL